MGSFTTDAIRVDGRPVRGTVTIEQERIDVTTEREPDPDWDHLDSNGHLHRWDIGERDRLPSLCYVLDDPYWCVDCCDEHQFGHHECILCGEQVSPSTRATIGRRYILGPRHITVDVDEALPLGPVTVMVPGDPPQELRGQVVSCGWSSEGGSAHIIVTDMPPDGAA